MNVDPETKKAAEFCRVAGVGHVVASKPPLKPIERYRTEERLPDVGSRVLTNSGYATYVRSSDDEYTPDWCALGLRWLCNRDIAWWAYLPEGDE